MSSISRALVLRRYLHDLEATWGFITHRGRAVCWTLECPWLGNKPFVSCIPAGSYRIVRHESPKFGICLAVANPPEGRSGILIHPGSKRSDTQGCILPGLVPERYGVSGSREALTRLMALYDDGARALEIL